MDLPRELSTVKAMLEKSKDPHLALLMYLSLNRILLVWSEPSITVNGKEDKEYIATNPTPYSNMAISEEV